MDDFENGDKKDVEKCLKLWRDRILVTKRKELSPGEVSSLFQQKDLQEAFFQIIDRDSNGSISFEEWTGCFSKIIGDKDTTIMPWFVEQFNQRCVALDKMYLDRVDFDFIASNVEFGYRFGSIISPRARRINCVQLITSLEIIASMSSDAKWLSWLKYQFTEAMIQSNRYSNMELYVTLDDFQQNFYFKEPFLAARIFSYLDKDKSGTLTLHEFINGLEVVVNGTQEEKMEFLFKAFDVDNDGTLDYNEVRLMLKCCMEESPSLEIEETVDDLASVLFKDIDQDGSGDISLKELKLAFEKNKALFKTLSVCTSVWIKPKFINKNHKKNIFSICKNFLINNKALVFFWGLYAIISLICTVTAYFRYINSNTYIIGARIFGNLLNFNCSLILVLVLRKHFTWFRIKGGASYLPVDDFIDIHKKIGTIIVFHSTIHTLFHLVNLFNYCVSTGNNYFTVLFTGYTIKDGIKFGYPTGVLLFGMLALIGFFATPFVRKKGYFELFYWFHMLTIPFLVILLSHGLNFYIWILIPGICFSIEKILKFRKVRSNKFGDTVISEAFILPSKVTHLVIRKPPKFRFKPGDYIFINIPTIAKNEWHPFSISSAPEKSDDIWLHIRSAGNWTNKLYQYSKSSKFDTSITSANSNFSVQARRLTMRARMSKVFNSSNEFYSNDNHPNNDDGEKRKRVCFQNNDALTDEMKLCNNCDEPKIVQKVNENIAKLENQDNELKSSELNLEKFKNNNNENENDHSFQIVDSDKPSLNPPIKHKGILKLISENKSAGNTNNPSNTIFKTFSFNDNNLNFNELPTESTPKRLSNSYDNKKTNEEDDLPEQQLVSPNSKTKVNTSLPLTAQEQSPNNLNKNKSKSLLDHNNDKNRVISGNLLKPISIKVEGNKLNFPEIIDSNKEFENNLKHSLVKENDNNEQQIVIDMKEAEKNKDKQELTTSQDDSDNFQVVIKDFKHKEKKRSIFFRNTGNNEKDELGYLKMYQKPNRVNIDTIGGDDVWRLKVYIDGPYGTPSHHIFDSEHAVLIAAGIGITPFASILQSLMFRYRQARAKCPSCNYKLSDQFVSNNDKLSVKKVDFIWITREQRSLEWFISLLSQMEIEQRKNDETFMETHLYVTSAKRESDLRTIGLHLTLDAIFSKEESTLIDGLRQRTHYGRPNWDIVMQTLIRKQKGKINVFYCGPPSLATTLSKKCQEYSLNFKKEIF